MADTKPIAFRAPIDLANALEARARHEGVSVGELVRNVLYTHFYGDGPSANEGYYQARANGTRIARMLLANALESMPASDEEAQEMLSGFDAKARAKQG